jgi:3'-phosphoadenosine 5'-phosphosulfate sulfotransferase (PAPS reductase)/FAD synthetase
MATGQLTPGEIIAKAVYRFDPIRVYALMSGGHDSLCAAHLAANHERFCERFSGVIHINTGIGIEETRQFVRETCTQFGWPLWEVTAKDWKEDKYQSYEDLVVDQGFPGPAHHWKMYHRLKERALRAVINKTPSRKRKIAFVSGRRREESQRRMVSCDMAIKTGEKNPSPRVVWVNPIIDWETIDKHKYMGRHGLPRNPVVEKLCMSGECLCGAFAKPQELETIRAFYPDAAAEIDRIACLAKAAGKPHVWGVRPDPAKVTENWSDFPKEHQMLAHAASLCSSCIEMYEEENGRKANIVAE